MAGEDRICVECKNVEKDASKLLTCMYCFSEAHYSCRNISSNAARRMKDKMYFCSPNCSSIYQRIVEMQNNKTSIVEALAAELKNVVFNAVSQEMKMVKNEVQQITAAVENSQQFLSDKFEAIVSDFLELKRENEKLKEEIEKLKHKQQAMSKKVNTLEHNMDKSVRQANCNNAVVLGVPYYPHENTYEIVNKVITCYGLNVQSDAIVSAERLSGKNKTVNSLIPIRVIFKDGDTKENIFARKKECGRLLSSSINEKYVINGKPTTIAMRDELSPLSLELLKEMRGYQEKLNLKYVWSSRGGNVLVKRNEHSKPEIVKTRDDIYEMINRYKNTRRGNETFSPKSKCDNNIEME